MKELLTESATPLETMRRLLLIAEGAFADGTSDDIETSTAERVLALRESMAASMLVLATAATIAIGEEVGL